MSHLKKELKKELEYVSDLNLILNKLLKHNLPYDQITVSMDKAEQVLEPLLKEFIEENEITEEDELINLLEELGFKEEDDPQCFWENIFAHLDLNLE